MRYETVYCVRCNGYCVYVHVDKHGLKNLVWTVGDSEARVTGVDCTFQSEHEL